MANGWIYQNGKVVSLTSPITEKQHLLMSQGKKGGLAGEKLMDAGDQQCNSARVDTYFWACIGVGPSSTCGWHPKGSQYITVCRPVTFSGDETTIDYIAPPDYGGYWPEGFDCHGDYAGNARWTDECGCIEGNTGIVSCPQKEIIDSLRGYPCAQALLRKLPNLNNAIGALIKKTFGVNANIDLQFSVDNSLKDSITDGHFIGWAGIAPNNGATYKIGINPDVLKNASQEYILVTLYHEALHAYVAHAKATMSAEAFAITFGSLSFNGGRTLFVPVANHFELAANNYLNGLRDAVISFNSTYNIDRAYSLAKCGVVNVNATDDTINKQERDTTKPGYTGTKCP